MRTARTCSARSVFAKVEIAIPGPTCNLLSVPFLPGGLNLLL